MPIDGEQRWQEAGAKVSAKVESPERFLLQQIAPLLYSRATPTTLDVLQLRDTVLTSECDFWQSTERSRQGYGRPSSRFFDRVTLESFTISDWFPRAPGVFWSDRASRVRGSVWALDQEEDSLLGGYYKPREKESLIEGGGLGTIRLRPRTIDGEYCWLATAVAENHCCAGVPLAIPETLLRTSNFDWGETATVSGRVRFLQDVGLDDIANQVHGARPLILFVEDLHGEFPVPGRKPPILSPVVLLKLNDWKSHYGRHTYTFAQCTSGSDSNIDSVCEWMEHYATKFAGTVITNFDEQRPSLANAPLSYQRLVTKTYDRQIIHQYGGTVMAEYVETLIQEDFSTHYHGAVHMGHNISVGGNAIVNIDSKLAGVIQTIGTAAELNPRQKADLDLLVQNLKSDLDTIKAEHSEESAEIVEAVQKVVAAATRPPEERKKPFLDLKASNLIAAAKLVADIAPSVFHGAEKLAQYVQGLV